MPTYQLGQNAVIELLLRVVPAEDLDPGDPTAPRDEPEPELRPGKANYHCGRCHALLASGVSTLQTEDVVLECPGCGAVCQAPWAGAAGKSLLP